MCVCVCGCVGVNIINNFYDDRIVRTEYLAVALGIQF